MNKSETIANISAALSKFQSEITDIKKEAEGYSHRYATLAGVLDVTRPLCYKNGLAVTQLTVSDPNVADMVGVETVLTHSSGEWLSSTMWMPIIPANKGMSMAQAQGSAVTFLRRYAITAILGVTQIDDVESATEPVESKPKENPALAKAMAQAKPKVDDETEKLIEQLKTLAKAKGVSKEDRNEWCARYNVANISDMSSEQLTEIITAIKGQ